MIAPLAQNAGDDVPKGKPPLWQPRFGIGAMMLVMFVCSVMGAAGFYLLRALRDGNRIAQLGFILFTLAAPILLVVVVSAVKSLSDWVVRRRRSR